MVQRHAVPRHGVHRHRRWQSRHQPRLVSHRAGKCLHPDVTGQPRKLFSFAEAVDSEGRTIKINSRPLNWGGTTTLCTRETQFEFTEQGDCGGRGLNASGYAQVDMAAGAGKTLRFGMP